MGRSLKKGPFVEAKLLKAIDEMNKVGMEALVKLYPDLQDRVKDILNTELTQQGGIVQEGIKSATSENTAQTSANAQRDVATIQTDVSREKLPYEIGKTQSQEDLNRATAYYNGRAAGMSHEQALAYAYGSTQDNAPVPTQNPTQSNPQIQPNLVRDNDGNAVNPVNTQIPQQAPAPTPTNTNNQGNNIWNNVVGIGSNLVRYNLPGGVGALNYGTDFVNTALDQARQRGWIGGNN